MTDFINILTHGRRLQAATKELSLAELEEVQDKLTAVIEKRREQLIAEEAELAEKQAKIAAIKQQMEEAGLDVSDFNDAILTPVKSKQSGQKRPIKYVITVDGQETKWTGIGRMPRVFADALEQGRSLEDFAI